MKAKFIIKGTSQVNEIGLISSTFILDAPDSLIVREMILNRLSEISLKKGMFSSNEEPFENKWEVLNEIHSSEIDELIRPTLIKYQLLEPNSNYNDCDMNIDNMLISEDEILNEDVALRYEVKILNI
jgi:hypothetical protein